MHEPLLITSDMLHGITCVAWSTGGNAGHDTRRAHSHLGRPGETGHAGPGPLEARETQPEPLGGSAEPLGGPAERPGSRGPLRDLWKSARRKGGELEMSYPGESYIVGVSRVVK